jgi:SAM-dependent methyltransferase
MLGLLFGGATMVLLGWAVVALTAGAARYLGMILMALGAIPLFFGLLMVLYAFAGKARTRDHILHLADLRDGDTVLDVGTGAGLLLVAAAKRNPRGTAIGIDLWSAKDLSNNAAATTLRNIAVEGVDDRAAVRTADARALPFPDAGFDRVLSLLCLHNIEDETDQRRACHEIARVLKPGGRIVIGDYVPTHRYAAAFADAGLHIVRSRPAFGIALSLMWIVVAERPADTRI